MRFRDKLIQFMYGRYGMDQFNKALGNLVIILLILGMLFPRVFYIPGMLLMWYTIFRCLSKNIAKRSRENSWYLQKEHAARVYLLKEKDLLSQRKEFHIYRCPSCKQKIRVPRGRGKIVITCRKCGKEFIKKS